LLYCLWCEDEIVLQVSWINFIGREQQNEICTQCAKQLVELNGKRCLKCSRETSESNCYDCERWDLFYNQRDPLTWNYSIFHYNSFIKEVITQWKYRGDYALVKIFKNAIIKQFKYFVTKVEHPYIVVPIPLSEERLYERGFNQAEMLANFLSGMKIMALTRNTNTKQATKTKIERIQSDNPFKLIKRLNKPVVLVDDIYTTGRTLRHAAQLLQQNGCNEIYALTLCRA